MSGWSRAAMDPSPAMRVFTSATLFRCVTTYMTGWPLSVLQLLAQQSTTLILTHPYVSASSGMRRRDIFPLLGHIIDAAVVAGDTDMLERLERMRVSAPYYRDHRALRLDGIAACAVYHHQLGVLEWLCKRMPSYDSTVVWGDLNLLTIAIETNGPLLRGDTRLLDLLDANCPRELMRIDLQKLLALARTGRLDLIQWLHAHVGTAPFTPGVMDTAAANGHLDLVRFLHEHRTEGCTTMAMDDAAKNGHFAVLRFLHEHRHESCTTRAMDTSVGVGNLAIAAYLHEHRTEGCTIGAMTQAASRGHLESVQFLHAIHPEPFSTDAMDEAAANDHLAVVQFLHEHRTEGYTRAAIDVAARRGYHRVVEFLCVHRSEGCSPTTLADVAARGFANTVRVLCVHSQQGCLVAARRRAERRNFTEVLDVLREFIASDVSDCSESLHDNHGPRRCQRQVLEEQDAAVVSASATARIRGVSE